MTTSLYFALDRALPASPSPEKVVSWVRANLPPGVDRAEMIRHALLYCFPAGVARAHFKLAR